MASSPTTASPWRIEFDRTAQIKAALVAAAFIATFWYEFIRLKFYWTTSQDWSHGPIIPFFSAYLVYQRWDEVRRCPVRYAWLGLPVILLSLAFYQYSLWGFSANYLRYTAMMLCLAGVVILLCGVPVLRYVWLPLLYLFFAIPLPKGLYFALTNPLREIAARVATGILGLFPNLDIEQIGSTIEYFHDGTTGQLGVADACSGMRSTITLCALGVAVAYMWPRPWWHRAILIVACVPIAVFSNLIRVTTTCILHIYVDPKYATGTYHTALGLVTILIAFGVFSGLGWVLRNLFVLEPDDDADGAPASA